MSVHNTIIYASFDTSQFVEPEKTYANHTNDSVYPFINTVPATISYTISARSVSHTNTDFNFTSNGVDGLGSVITTFQIPKINFTNQKIYFVARLKSNSTPLKREPLVQTETIFLETQNGDSLKLMNTRDDSIVLDDGKLFLSLITSGGKVLTGSNALFTTNFGDLTSNNGGGYYKGFLTTPLTGKDMRIKIHYERSNGIVLSGFSTKFDIFPSKGEYDVRKCKEDNDQTAAYKRLIFQEGLQNKPKFFDELLGNAVGNKNSSPETLGIKTYEKTANFVSNTSDINYCNLKALLSIMNSLNINYENYNQKFPPSINRLIDLLSVGVSHQKKLLNQYQLNFDDKGYTSKTVFGKNKAAEIDFETGILKTGEDAKYILTYEKFSENYKLVNTNLLSATNVDYKSNKTYALSSYNETWGWGLVIPKDVKGLDIMKYYEFYDYNNLIEGSVIKDFIDYTNTHTTYFNNISSYDDAMGKDKIADNLLTHNLLSNCGLVDTNSISLPADSIASGPVYSSQGTTGNTVTVANTTATAFAGDYVFNADNGRYERSDNNNIYFYHDGTVWRFFYGANNDQPQLPSSITLEQGFWTSGADDWFGTTPSSSALANYLAGITYTINF